MPPFLGARHWFDWKSPSLAKDYGGIQLRLSSVWHWLNCTGSNLQSTWALLSTAKLTAGEQNYKLSAKPGDEVQPQAQSVQALEEQSAQNHLR